MVWAVWLVQLISPPFDSVMAEPEMRAWFAEDIHAIARTSEPAVIRLS